MLLISIADSFNQPPYIHKRMNFRNSNHASYSGLKWYEPRYRYITLGVKIRNLKVDFKTGGHLASGQPMNTDNECFGFFLFDLVV